MRKIGEIFKYHQLAIYFACLVGIIYVAPYIISIMSLGDKYQGIPIQATANEDFYLARVQEIIDGHPMLGSFAFYEYKDQPSLTPPIAEMFYAIPSLLFGISLVKVLIASKFILPFILFLLVYYLINRLVMNSNLLTNKLNAIAGALLVTLGYDLADYRTLWLYLNGETTLGGKFLIWARPVNPVMGAVFLFSFLICVWLIIKKSRYKKSLIILASIFLALMIASYFFSWGVAVSVLGILILMYILKKEFKIVKKLLWVILLTIIMTLPYWYISLKASRGLSNQETLLKNGLYYTHYPLLNRVLLASLLFYFIVVALSFIFRKEKIKLMDSIKNWHLFTLALLLGGFWALNQQVVTGITIWPYHFVQYTIPLSMVAIMVLLYNVIKERWYYLWIIIVSIITSSSLIFGIIVQVETYKLSYKDTADLQLYKPALEWLNKQEKDSVVLVKIDDRLKNRMLNGLIPAFTHANIYASNWSYNITESDRMHFSYLTNLRLIGITPDKINKYLEENRGEARGYLFSNWKGLYGLKDFPDVTDPFLEARIKQFPRDYQEFMAKDFLEELKKYRLDYLLSDSPLSQDAIKQFGNTKLAFSSNNIYIYDLR
ncbi:MAG: hypothetical protein ABIB72_01595 [Candidatus Falkowbacteria bacterium]